MWWKKFKLLCWKNWIMIKRHWITSALEILFPIAVVLLLTYIYKDESVRVTKEQKYEAFDLKPEKCEVDYDYELSFIGFTPDNEVTRNLMENVNKEFKFEIQGFKNEAELEKEVKNEKRNTTAAVGIVFDESFMTSNYTHLSYKIRFETDYYTDWRTEDLYVDDRHPRINNKKYPDYPKYFKSCFMAIQNAIDRSFIGNETIPSLKLKAFPHPEIKDSGIMEMREFFSFLFVCCMILPVYKIISNISTERESGLKESIKMVGLSSGIYWSTWFVRCFLMLIIPFTINSILLSTKIFIEVPVFLQSNTFIVWIFMVVYIFSVITFGFMMSVIFKKPSTSAIVGSLLFLLTSIIIFVSIDRKFSALSYFSKMLFCFLINTNLGIGVNLITNREIFGYGMNFSNFFDRDIKMNFSLAELLGFMLLGSLFQVLTTFYIERVFPGDYGIAEPWYFPFKYLTRSVKKSISTHEILKDENGHVNTDYEPEPKNLRVGIEICSLKKNFGAKLAVNNLSLRMFENQITVLLGHNGAGKTTTMSMLVGLFSPTSGTAYLNGKDIRNEIEEARKSVGICPQYDILFNDLTVEEHLIFYCSLKGMISNDEIQREIRRYTDMLNLTSKLTQLSSTLSGGMKRKLSVAIALCADTKIVVLDEPSSGMDPGARRELWNVLIAEKRNRTILLSTHFLDEADVLGDRIAIMSDGTLRTVGSSFFLKQKFGTGYRIICEKGKGFNSRSALNVLKEHASDAQIEYEGDTEITFIVDERKLPIFDKMLKAFEDRSKELKIPSFGCNLSSLEDVFIRLGSEAMVEKANEKTPLVPRNDPNVTIYLRSIPNATGSKLFFYQVQAILMKKFYVFLRSWKSLLGMLVISLILFFFNSVNPEVFEDFSTEPLKPLNLTLDEYDGTTTLMEGNGKFADAYKKLFDGENEIMEINKNLEIFALKTARKSVIKFSKKYIIGASFKNDSILAWFNGQNFHSMPLTIHMINRAILKFFRGSDFDISTANFPYDYEDKHNNSFKYDPKEMNKLTNLIILTMETFILLLYWPFVLTAHYVSERDSNVKLMQFISGMNRYIYWITSFIFDLIVFFIIWCILYGYVMAVGYESVEFKTLAIFMLITMFFAFSMLPLSYLCSFLFKKTGTFIGVFTGLSFIITIVSQGVTVALMQIPDNFKLQIANWIGLLLPPYTLVQEFNFALNHILLSDENSLVSEKVKDFWSLEHGGVGRCLLANLTSGLIFLLLCLLIDLNVFTKIYYNILDRPRELIEPTHLDPDVRAEVEKIRQLSQQEINMKNLVLRRLTKFYKEFMAVNQLFLEVPPRECFGMLGVNGAGKTTAFKMMTGDILISGGDVTIQGNSIKNGTTEIYKIIGYCPQFDGLIQELTGAEILRFFALVRGIDKTQIQEIIELTSRDLGFSQHLHKPIRTFSGGNKRKLSASLALLGDPQIIFLDEPTTGIDPQARRMVWNAINKARDSGRTVILTSHSMDECEALCTRVGIMAKGEFKCLGSIQYLKNKFSKGYVLTIKMGRDDASLMHEIKVRVQAIFGLTAVFKERYLNILTFHISQTNLKWSEMFRNLATMKGELDVSEYALTQMTLEQVFLLITKEQ